ncbi:MAG TPA: SRPBCC domain-containing protein [Rhizomicrobium sp.]|nr:SRPBCC domain-containing protein [Rhizomicrobium sp.]
MTADCGTAEDCASEDGVRCSVTVAAPRARAFAAFRHDILAWWPRDETWSGDVIEDLYFEGRKGGLIWERGPGGFRLDMARVERWLQPERIHLRWHVGPGRVPEPDPAKASEVEIRFLPEEGGGTRVELEHRGFARHGEGADAYRARMGSDLGWPRILRCFAGHFEPRRETAASDAKITPLRLLPEFVA